MYQDASCLLFTPNPHPAAMPRPTPLTDDELQRLLPQALALPDAPADWLQRAVAAFEPCPTLLQRLQAVLRFDSWAQPAPALALRRRASPERHLIFSSPLGEVELRVVPDGTGFALGGQVLAAGASGWVSMADAATALDNPALRQPLTELGEFHLDAVPAGPVRLNLCLGDALVELPAFEVPPPHTP